MPLLSDVAFVNQGWANFIIPLTLASGVLGYILKYFQEIKPGRIVKVSDKDDPRKVYEVQISNLKQSPLENEVMDVLIKGKTYVDVLVC